jgi:hypothetical protein
MPILDNYKYQQRHMRKTDHRMVINIQESCEYSLEEALADFALDETDEDWPVAR